MRFKEGQRVSAVWGIGAVRGTVVRQIHRDGECLIRVDAEYLAGTRWTTPITSADGCIRAYPNGDYGDDD